MLEHLLEQIKALNIEETKNLLEDFGILEFNVLDEENNTILHLAIKAFLEQEKNVFNAPFHTRSSTRNSLYCKILS